MGKGFLKFMRNDELVEELFNHPFLFTLLAKIAYRSRRHNGPNIKGLELGEAVLGDLRGDWTLRRYRTAKAKAEKTGLAAFKATSKGTVAKLTGTHVFDANIEESDKQEANKRQAERPEKTRVSSAHNTGRGKHRDKQATNREASNKEIRNIRKKKRPGMRKNRSRRQVRSPLRKAAHLTLSEW